MTPELRYLLMSIIEVATEDANVLKSLSGNSSYLILLISHLQRQRVQSLSLIF